MAVYQHNILHEERLIQFAECIHAQKSQPSISVNKICTQLCRAHAYDFIWNLQSVDCRKSKKNAIQFNCCFTCKLPRIAGKTIPTLNLVSCHIKHGSQNVCIVTGEPNSFPVAMFQKVVLAIKLSKKHLFYFTFSQDKRTPFFFSSNTSRKL